MLTIRWRNTRFTLLPERALLWDDLGLLLVADVHLGKAHTFRRLGVPVPAGTTANALTRLSQLLERTHPQRLVILGDLFHSTLGNHPDLLASLADFRQRFASVHIELVCGNHDCAASARDARLDVHLHQLRVGDFLLSHHPAQSADLAVIAGHLHPGVCLSGRGDPGLTAPCFVFHDDLAILPAFGAFTGLARFTPSTHARLFAIGPDCVIPVGGSALADAEPLAG